ncbi:RNA polymerase sigma factor [Nocardioides flavus (ex Wang et al. 2016)]
MRAGDAIAFETLYAELSDPVFGFCLRRTGEWETAQDCTSLVFLEAWRLRATLRAESAGLAWVFGVAHNVVRNTTRAKRRHRSLLQRLPLGVLTDDVEGDVAARVDAKAEAARVLVPGTGRPATTHHRRGCGRGPRPPSTGCVGPGRRTAPSTAACQDRHHERRTRPPARECGPEQVTLAVCSVGQLQGQAPIRLVVRELRSDPADVAQRASPGSKQSTGRAGS